MVDPREDKLPKWAQVHIDNLRRTAERATDELDAFRSGTYGPADTDTYSDSYRDQERLNLPKGGTIAFVLGYDHNDEIRARVRYDGELEIQGLGAITVEPQASNVVVVKLKRS